MTPLELKTILLAECFNYVATRKKKVLKAIATIEESLFEEGKSTAGDKHHTGRAMLQIDRENVGKQLFVVEKLEEVVNKITLKTTTNTARLGSLVFTKNGDYFLSISAGAITVNDRIYLCVSTGSPIGQLILGKKEGAPLFFNGNEFLIKSVS